MTVEADSLKCTLECLSLLYCNGPFTYMGRGQERRVIILQGEKMRVSVGEKDYFGFQGLTCSVVITGGIKTQGISLNSPSLISSLPLQPRVDILCTPVIYHCRAVMERPADLESVTLCQDWNKKTLNLV